MQFLHDAGQQEFFATKGFQAPSRCRDCINVKKQAMEWGGKGAWGAPAFFGKGGYGGGFGGGFGLK